MWFTKSTGVSYPALATPRTIAYQASLSMGFSRQEYWSRLLFPSPGDLPGPGTELWSPAFQVDSCISGMSLTNWATRETPQKNTKGSYSCRRKMISDRNLDLKCGRKMTGSGKYTDKYEHFFSYFSKFILKITGCLKQNNKDRLWSL